MHVCLYIQGCPLPCIARHNRAVLFSSERVNAPRIHTHTHAYFIYIYKSGNVGN